MAVINKAQVVRDYLKENSKATPQEVSTSLTSNGVNVTARYVSSIKSKLKSNKTVAKKNKSKSNNKKTPLRQAKYPRHNLEKALRIPQAILEQNAGRECSEEESATFVGVQYNKGPYASEISSAIKFGLIERPRSGRIQLTELAKEILRPQNKDAKLKGLREAILKAPDIADVYEHYRGENLPDDEFFRNAIVDKFGIPHEKLDEFKSILMESLSYSQLVEENNDKYRVIDVSGGGELPVDTEARIKKLGKGISVSPGDICFVMMPFAEPHGSYYSKIYEPAIRKAGLHPLRADNEIFGTGKIIDQIWDGINNAKVLVAELTTRNPNVFYELGLAHALKKPVVLVSANESDVPFDLKHIRVIYYDVADPFWGNKLMDKVAENVLSALKNPEEAQFPGVMELHP